MEGAPSVRAGALPGLDTVRVLAALNVLVAHWAAYEHVTAFPLLSGGDAVTLFFTLSGYLVAYRLISEQRSTGRIDARAFYTRRAQRLLPQYYLLILIGGILLPLFGAPSPSGPALASSLLLMPQLPYALGMPMGLIVPLWSLGVEEIFYALFPLALRRWSVPQVSLTVIVTLTLASAIAQATNNPLLPLLRLMRLECMAVGALAAWIVLYRDRWLVGIYHHEMVAIGTLAGVALLKRSLPAHDLSLSIVAAVLLVNVSTNPRPLLRLEYAWSKRAGQLSYGLYLWHVPVLWVMLPVARGLPFLALSIVGALGMAWLSQRLIEGLRAVSENQVTRRDTLRWL